MSVESADADKTNPGPHSVPEFNVQDVDANENIRIDSSRTQLQSGIITEGDSKSRQKSGKSRPSSGKYWIQISLPVALLFSKDKKKLTKKYPYELRIHKAIWQTGFDVWALR